MSAKGQKQTSRLFDHIVGASEERWLYGETDCFCGLQVDYELKFGGLLHWNVCGLGSLQNSVSDFGRPRKQLREIWSIRHKAPGQGPISSAEYRGHLCVSRGRYNE
jgi:hypothetical protein